MPVDLLIAPDGSVFRLLYSQGVALEDLGVLTRDDSRVESDNRRIWRRSASSHMEASHRNSV
jgi:glucuronate isomerase